MLPFDGDTNVEACVFDATLVSTDAECGIEGGGGGKDDKEEEGEVVSMPLSSPPSMLWLLPSPFVLAFLLLPVSVATSLLLLSVASLLLRIF